MSRSTAVPALLAAAILLIGVWVSPTEAGDCAGTITVTIEHVSSQSNSVSVVDAINGESKINDTMQPWEKRSISICKSDSGYGRLNYKKGGQSGWTEASLLKSGETVKI